MPPHVRPERFERNLVNAMMQTPELMDLDPRLIFREISKAAALGLYLDPQLGEAYLIAGWNGKAKRKEPQLRIGYRGLIKLGRQSGEISMMYAHEVHAKDFFEASLGDDKKLVHKPDLFGDRGPVVGYYAVVKYKDGESDFEPLTVAQAHAIRDRSDGWKAFSEGKIKSTPWATDEVEMSKKTAIRRLTKRIPQSPELAEAIRIEDAAEHSDMRVVSPEAAAPAPRPPRPGPRPDASQAPNDAPQDSDKGGPIIDGETIDESGGENAEATTEIEAATDTEAVTEDGEIIGGGISSAIDDDWESYVNELRDRLFEANDVETVEEIWTNLDPMARFEGDDHAQDICLNIKLRRIKMIEDKGKAK